MEIIKELKKLESAEMLLYSAFFLATLAPGFLLLYQYKPELVYDYSILKLVLFSASLTLPVLFVNLLIVAGVAHEMSSTPSSSEGELKFIMVISCIITFISYYTAIHAAYLFSLKFSTFIRIIAGIEFAIFAVAVETVRRIDKKKASKS